MTIDVDHYIDVYIHYHVQRMQYMADYADTIFVPLRDNAINDLKNAASMLNARASMFNNANHLSPAQALDFADNLSNGTLLMDTLNDIASTLNTAIDAELTKATVDDYYSKVLSFASLLETSNPNVKMVKDFLTLLANALAMTGGYDKRLIGILRSFGRDVVGHNIRWNPGGVQLISEEQSRIIGKIEDALNRAVARYEQGGRKLSAASFRQTIAYIFRGLLGSSLAKAIVSNVENEVLMERVPQILQSLKFKPEGLAVSKRRSSISERAGIINTKGMTLDVVSNGTTFTVEIGSDLNYKEVPASTTNDLNIVASSTIGNYLMFDDLDSTNYAYNLIAHQGQVYSAYSEVISTVAASFLRDTLLQSVNKNQAYQFLLINGKVYPVLSIIANICDKTLQFGIIPDIISMDSTPRGTNSWWGDSGPDWELAEQRSKMVKQVIDTLKIGLYFNSNILLPYLT